MDYATADGTAKVADSDYVPASGTLTLAGETTHTVTVSVIGDTTIEGDETLFVNLSNAAPFKVKIALGQAQGVIVNDDFASISTLSQWGLLTASILILLLGLGTLRRQRVGPPAA